MRIPILVAIVAVFVCNQALATVTTKEITYSAGGKSLKGYLAYDDAAQDKRPGIVVFPEWWGTTDYPKHRALQLAELGYVAFAADMYGDAKTTDDPKEAGQLAGSVKKNPELEKQLIQAAIDTLKQQPQVDPDRLGAIGYCFGGTMALDAARTKMPVKAVVSFHGDLSTQQPAQQVDSKVLVLTGGADSFVPPQQVEKFKQEMSAAGAQPKVIVYPGAHHSFTNPDADRHHLDNIKYNADADQKSWDEMKRFFAEVFGK
jgi:dienelactone hydrolase